MIGNTYIFKPLVKMYGYSGVNEDVWGIERVRIYGDLRVDVMCDCIVVGYLNNKCNFIVNYLRLFL